MTVRVKVQDVMTDQVTSVESGTPFKDVAETLIARGVSAVPVLDADDRVSGVISEADLLYKEEFREQYYREGYQPPLRLRLLHPGLAKDTKRKAEGDTAYELMTAPAITIRPDATVTQAARTMDEHGIKRLIVVDADGCLLGIVSRHDLLKVFVRTDADIAREVREDVLERSLWVETELVRVQVGHGIVTLSGRMKRRSESAIAARMTQRVNGVVDVINKMEWDEDDDSSWYGR